MNKGTIVVHLTNELLTYKNAQFRFVPFDIISKGILVNALMQFYVPQEFKMFHTQGTKVCGEIHIEPMLKVDENYKIKFEVEYDRISIKLMDENTTTCQQDSKARYDRAMRGL